MFSETIEIGFPEFQSLRLTTLCFAFPQYQEAKMMWLPWSKVSATFTSATNSSLFVQIESTIAKNLGVGEVLLSCVVCSQECPRLFAAVQLFCQHSPDASSGPSELCRMLQSPLGSLSLSFPSNCGLPFHNLCMGAPCDLQERLKRQGDR